uniref:Uncharacterized protein n=1 Tax=Anguilla anguilla TaxID=7936 RepID=A0A0E9UJ75_ANGAN
MNRRFVAVLLSPKIQEHFVILVMFLCFGEPIC